MRIKYTPESLADVQRLRGFVAQTNPLAARRLALELQEGIEKLKLFPKMGILVALAENSDLMRDLYVNKYTIRYLNSDDQLIVLRLWHSKETEKDL